MVKKYLINFVVSNSIIVFMLIGISNQIFCQSHKIKVGIPETISNNQGDTWIAAFSVGDTIYTPSNDTKGFYEWSQNFKSNIAFNKFVLNKYPFPGITINQMTEYGSEGQKGTDSCTWKSSGCYAIDSVIYWVIARHRYGDDSGDANKRQLAKNASIIKSYDRGKTWIRTQVENYDQPMFPGSRFATPYFIQFGTDGYSTVDNADKYVYAVSNNGFWDNGDNLILGRVPRNKIAGLNAADWQFYTGGDGMKDNCWNNDVNKAKLIIDSPGKLGMSGIVYNAAVKKYLYIGWYYPAGGGKLPNASRKTVWDFYESDKPWGPWITIGSVSFEPQGYYSPQICPKLISDNGMKFTVFTAGDWYDDRFYRLTLVPIEILVK